MTIAESNILVVPPFECTWLDGEGLLFPKPGKCCVCFEARADNDVTLTFKEHAGAKHYRTDVDRNYTVVLGSHRNRLLKIEVDGRAVAESAITIPGSHTFQRYWIDVSSGVISVGKGDPGHGMVLQWRDPQPNLSLQYIGLSSWDKHVIYRGVKVMDAMDLDDSRNVHLDEQVSISDFLMSPKFADVCFFLGKERRGIFGHRVILASCCHLLDFSLLEVSDGMCVMHLPFYGYEPFSSLLRYAYTGSTKIRSSLLGDLLGMSRDLGFQNLTKIIQDIAKNKTPPSPNGSIDTEIDIKFSNLSAKDVAPSSSSSPSSTSSPMHGEPHPSAACFKDLPIDMSLLMSIYTRGTFSDVSLCVLSSPTPFKSHRIILSAISLPLARMLSSDMLEGLYSQIIIGETHHSTLSCILNFIYYGKFHGYHLCYNEPSTQSHPLPPSPFSLSSTLVGNLHSEVCSSVSGEEEDGIPLLELLAMADRLCMDDMKAFCCDSLISVVDMESACIVLSMAHKFEGCDALCKCCEDIISQNFDFCAFTLSSDFKLIPMPLILNIIQSSNMVVSSEEMVLEAIIVWASRWSDIRGMSDLERVLNDECPKPQQLQQETGQADDLQEEEKEEGQCNVECDGEEKKSIWRLLRKEILSLIPFIRFPLMSLSSLIRISSTIFYKKIPQVHELVKEALEHLNPIPEPTPSRPKDGLNGHCRYVHKFQDELRFTHRLGSQVYKRHLHPLLYVCDGDNNGAIHFAGTGYGSQKWMNPVLSKKVIVSASSPPSRYTDPRLLASGNFHFTSYAGPCQVASGNLTCFWKVDFGENHQLLCNYYTIRQDGSANYPRNWMLEASSDEENWVELRVHREDPTIFRPGQYASFPIVGGGAFFPARYFRLRMHGPSSDLSKPWHLCICYMELYGYFL